MARKPSSAESIRVSRSRARRINTIILSYRYPSTALAALVARILDMRTYSYPSEHVVAIRVSQIIGSAGIYKGLTL